MEADLLQYLLKNAGKVVSRKAILEDVWNLHEDTDTRAIDNFIVRLRRFLNEDPDQSATRADGARDRLQVHRRSGYRSCRDQAVNGRIGLFIDFIRRDTPACRSAISAPGRLHIGTQRSCPDRG